MNEANYTSIFESSLLANIPLFYRFMQRIDKEEFDKIEQQDFGISASSRHRSSTYEKYEPFKPVSKFIPTRVITKLTAT